MTKWFTAQGPTPEETETEVARIVAAWPDAPTLNLETLGMVLNTARTQVVAFAPDPEEAGDRIADLLAELGYAEDTIGAVLALLELDPPADPIERYVFAQLGQAKTLYNAGSVNSAGEVGMDGFTFTPRPLDKVIRSIIRPTEGGFSVG